MDDYQGFEPAEVEDVVNNYVCSVCHGALVALQIPNDRISIIVCLEHGNIETCGRVTKNTVSIELERGYLDYKEVVRNLSDLWGDLIETGYKVKKSTALRIMHECVCRKCGSNLGIEHDSRDGFWIIKCHKCGDVEQNGFVKEGEYHANSRTY